VYSIHFMKNYLGYHLFEHRRCRNSNPLSWAWDEFSDHASVQPSFLHESKKLYKYPPPPNSPLPTLAAEGGIRSMSPPKVPGDIVSQGTINLGTKGTRTFAQGHIVWWCPVTPPQLVCNPAKKLYCTVHIKTNVSFNGKTKNRLSGKNNCKFALSRAHFSLWKQVSQGKYVVCENLNVI